MLVVGAVGVAVFGRALSMELVGAAFAVIGTYGLLGAWLSPEAWRAARAPALLAVLALPLAPHLDLFVGFPLRLLTATAVHHALGAAGVHAIATETVLEIEGTTAHVDVPCGGVRSLSTGLIVLLAAASIEGRPVGRRFFGIVTAQSTVLVVANAVRVLTLVLLTAVAGRPAVADLVHVPLGLAGFGLACGLGVGLLRLLPERAARPSTGSVPHGALAVLVVALAFVPVPRSAPAVAAPVVTLPGEPLPLGEAEARFFAGLGVTVDERTFEGPVPGVVAVVPSADWRAQHPPEWCLAAAGVRVGRIRTMLVGGEAVRVASAGDHTAIWWFQSRDRATDDLAVRVWHGVLDPDEPWVLVSLLLAGDADPTRPDLADALAALRAHVGAQLEPS
jgi:exosortase O